MRRLATIVLLTVLATTTYASDVWNESNPRDRDGRAFDRARHMILNPVRPLTPEDRAQLLAKGVEVQQSLSGGRYVARVIDAATATDDMRIAAVAPFTVEQKILRSATRAGARGRTWANVTIIFHKDVSFADARRTVLAAGAAMDDIFATRFSAARRLDVRIAPSALAALAASEEVLAIGGRMRSKAIPHNARAAALSHVPEVYAAPYNLSGEGQVVMVSEVSDAQASHPEFGGRLVAAGPDADGQHSTHVSGTIGASGIRADAKGMAPNAQIREFDVGRSLNSHIRVLDEQLPVLRPVANNTSLGFPLGWCSAGDCGTSLAVWLDDDEYYGAYDAVFTAVYDDLTEEFGTLLVFSAGNDGNLPTFGGEISAPHYHVIQEGEDRGETDETKVHCFVLVGQTTCPTALCTGSCETFFHHAISPFDTMTVTGSGKNVLAVGAALTVSSPPVFGSISSFSSRGPAKDGRVKPELVARGQTVLSTTPNSSYQAMSGTSMAAPVVSGIAALIGEQWQKTFGARAKVSELRGVLLAGAQDIGNPGPDYTHGYGLVDAKASADLIVGDGGARTQIATVTLNQGTRVQRDVTVTAQQTLRVLVTWADPSVILLGDDAFNAQSLVNDLDVQVIAPNGTTHLPWILDKVNYEANATRGVNVVDNTELIEIANAAPGVYKVVINGTRVPEGPQDAHVITNAKGVTLQPCSDVQEPNNAPESAFGNVPPGSLSGGICSAGDVDFLKFEATRFGPVSATVTSGDTPLRATLTASNGQTATVDIPAGSTRTVSFQYGTGTAQAPPITVTLKIEATATAGSNPRYDVALSFGQFSGDRRRSARH